MFEIYCVVPTKGDNSSREDLFEYSLRELAERHSLQCLTFDNMKDLIKYIINNCIRYLPRQNFGQSVTYVKCPFVVKRDGKVIFDSKLSPDVGEVSVYMGTREILELDVAVNLEEHLENLVVKT